LACAKNDDSPPVEIPVAIPVCDADGIRTPPRKQSLAGVRKLAGDAPRVLLYTAVFVVLGALAIPGVLLNRRVGRLEKSFLCVGGLLQTAAAVGLLVWFIFWMVTCVKAALDGAPAPGPF
jgi:hypothetical protein